MRARLFQRSHGRQLKSIGHATDEDAHNIASDDVCAICFEHSSFVSLPCSCKISYCAPCWDRALATSIRNRGFASCPSCRTSFHVDFNMDAGCAVFSKAEKAMTRVEVGEIYSKTKPLQIQLLKNFGELARTDEFSREPQEDMTPVLSWQSASDQDQSVQNELDSQRSSKPLCVCGGHLERIDQKTRLISMLDDTCPGWKSKSIDDIKLLQSLATHISCDLCDESATRTGFVWTCKKGPDSLLHMAARDICEPCFSKYTECQVARPACAVGQCSSGGNEEAFGRRQPAFLSRCCFPFQLRQSWHQ